MSENYPHLATLGFSRLFTAHLVARWHQRWQDRPITLTTILEQDQDFVYLFQRAAGSEPLWRHSGRQARQQRRYLDYWAQTGRPLPTHDGNDDYVIVQAATQKDEETAYSLVPAASAAYHRAKAAIDSIDPEVLAEVLATN